MAEAAKSVTLIAAAQATAFKVLRITPTLNNSGDALTMFVS